MKKLILVAFATVLIGAQAFGFSGTIAFQGNASSNQASNVGGTTTVSFQNTGTAKTGRWHVTAGLGDYGFAVSGTLAQFNSVSFTGDQTGAMLTGPVSPQWSFMDSGNTYTFDLLSLTNGFIRSGVMNLAGTGNAYENGNLLASGNWTLNGSSTKGFSFKLSNNTTAVPDGGTAVALLGIALAGIEGFRRKIGARKA